MERLRVAAGFTGQVVPFKGAPEALTEVLAGRVDVYFSPLPPAVQLIESGQAHSAGGLQRQARRRAAERADHHRGRIPEFRFRFLDSGLFVPKQTPRDVVARIHEADRQRHCRRP